MFFYVSPDHRHGHALEHLESSGTKTMMSGPIVHQLMGPKTHTEGTIEI